MKEYKTIEVLLKDSDDICTLLNRAANAGWILHTILKFKSKIVLIIEREV